MPVTPHPNAHRDLLFGLLALQAGMIDQSQLCAAFASWAKGGDDRSIAAILMDHGLSSDRLIELESLVADHLSSHAGDFERGLASLQTDPAIRDHLSKLDHPALDQSLFHLAVSASLTEADIETLQIRAASAFQGRSSSSGGSSRYRILRTHRKGGLGVVFVADDTELHREVALKQIHEDRADETDTRQRFMLEAEITAGLEHPGIVPVYGLGVDEAGRPCYAMRFIKGDNLKDAIIHFHRRKRAIEKAAVRPLRGDVSLAVERSKLLRRFLDVCNAIEYAHNRGVLHRDIKPGNILIGKYGETLVVDWGLAKAVGKANVDESFNEQALTPSSSGSGETLPHSRVGTPAYMSPEQARGDLENVGMLSDVYGLGATLYYLLAGRPPFLGRELVELLDRVSLGGFPPPRSLDASLDPALEAICLKAMAREPKERYQSAEKLADDIERWLADDPVEAAPDNWKRQLFRWSRHNSSIVASVGVLLVTGLLALGVIIGLVASKNAQLAAANDEIIKQSQLATRMSLQAHAAVRDMLHEVAHNDLLNIPQAEPLRLKLAERASALILNIKKYTQDDILTLYDQAIILNEVALLYRLIGNFEKATITYGDSIDILDDLIAQHPDNPEYIAWMADAESGMGDVMRLRGGTYTEIEPHLRKAAELAVTLRPIEKLSRKYASFQATTLNELARHLYHSGYEQDAEPLARDAVEAAIRFRTTLPEQPDPKFYQTAYIIIPMCRVTYSDIRRKLKYPDWEEPLQLAIKELKEICAVFPESYDPRSLLVESSRILLEDFASNAKSLDKAVIEYDKIVEEMNQLVKACPYTQQYKGSLISLRTKRAALKISAGMLDAAEADLSFAREQLETRMAPNMRSLTLLGDYALVKSNLAKLAQKRGQIAKARDLINEANQLHLQIGEIDSENRAAASRRAEDEAFATTLQTP